MLSAAAQGTCRGHAHGDVRASADVDRESAHQAAKCDGPYPEFVLAGHSADGLAGPAALMEAQRLLKAPQTAGLVQARLDLGLSHAEARAIAKHESRVRQS